MIKGKEKCKALKEIRKQIAEKNDIEYAVSECSFQGECKGTCPKCEAELRYLERELAIKQGLGKAVAVVGISTGVCASLTACSPAETLEEITYSALEKLGIVETTTGVLPAPEQLEGDVAVDIPEPTDTPKPVATPESTNTPKPATTPEPMVTLPPEEILMGEMPMDTPYPEKLEAGEIIPEVTFLPEDFEGGIMMEVTPTPDSMSAYLLEGDIAVMPQGDE